MSSRGNMSSSKRMLQQQQAQQRSSKRLPGDAQMIGGGSSQKGGFGSNVINYDQLSKKIINSGIYNKRIQTTLLDEPEEPYNEADYDTTPTKPGCLDKICFCCKKKQEEPESAIQKKVPSKVHGRVIIPLSVMPITNVVITESSNDDGGEDADDNYNNPANTAQNYGLVPLPRKRPHILGPPRILEIENGNLIVVTTSKLIQNHDFELLGGGGGGSDGDGGGGGGEDGSGSSGEKDVMIVVSSKLRISNKPLILSKDAVADNPELFGTDIVVTGSTRRERKQRAKVRSSQSLRVQIQAGNTRELDSNIERGILGGAWRGILRRLMTMSLNEINGKQLGRQLQFFIPFLTTYEAYLISHVIEALDESQKVDVKYILTVAFKNRNVSRIIVQNTVWRWDYIWHWYRQVSKSRIYDCWGKLPIIGFTAFPPTENFFNTRNHVLASTFRVLLGEGRWHTRVVTGNRQGLVTDNPDRNIAQNLTAESNGFELANRNQYGNFVGRDKTNTFRIEHRLPTDESIVRTFISSPMSTMINNGCVHVLRQMAKHWHNILSQPCGNFAHQRMELLDPIETMRFYMPIVCVVLSSLRGRNGWDSKILGPFMKKCQELKSSYDVADNCRQLVREMRDVIAPNLCGGITSVLDPMLSWLDAIIRSCDMIEEEAKIVYEKITSVELGLRFGHDVLTQVSWKVPTDQQLKDAIMLHINGKNPGPYVSERRIRSAMLSTTPRDKRTLWDLVKQGFTSTKPCKMLLGRVKTLLQRDIRRETLNNAIRELSMGPYTRELVSNEWYWLEEGGKNALYICGGRSSAENFKFVHVDAGFERVVDASDGYTKFRTYVPVAEAIARAQRCYMNIELDHLKKFNYNAYMEFSYLRIPLRRLAVISQIFCEEIDNARIHILNEIKRSESHLVAPYDMVPGQTYYKYDPISNRYEPMKCEKKYKLSDPEWKILSDSKITKVKPQSIIVVGGGPTGLMTVLHCTENVLISGGEMKLYEARDAFQSGGASTFERAQIVRLDARWISMLRYHLGTGFEDIFVPASGETNAQLGNTLPTQGFVEITIKDLENMLHLEVSRLWSKGVIQCFTESKAKYDVASNSLTKMGEALKVGDTILVRVDPDGQPSATSFSWKVVDLIYTQALGLDDLRVGEGYMVYVRSRNAVLPFRLAGVDLQSRTYTFKALRKNVDDLKAPAHNLPSIYPKGTRRHADVSKIIIECSKESSAGGYVQDELPMKLVRKALFTLDIGNTHVIECIGKPRDSNMHFSVVTQEPYGVCCIQGLKISMGMHNFGETRWGSGLLDDFRSVNDQNTRVVGDFVKMVRQPRVAEYMYVLIKLENWQEHFLLLIADSKFPKLDNEDDPFMPRLEKAVKRHAKMSVNFNRQTLQTRFFETGDNYYLGMELTREYEKWKKETVDDLIEPLSPDDMEEEDEKDFEKDKADFRSTLMHHIDRLWYEACLEIIRRGDVYNPGARKRIPRLHLINSSFEEKLFRIPLGESFRLSGNPDQKYEVVHIPSWSPKDPRRKDPTARIIVRNVEGQISKFDRQTLVRREGNLTRAPDGNEESNVALSTFQVGHYVNHRTVRLSNESKEYVFAFIGDEQATPHFMRYSGLTGACINAMLFNNFIESAIEGNQFMERFQLYARETNWSNSEVVTRGTGSLFGQDGFLRPGFSYSGAIAYLHSKVVEGLETQQDMNDILSSDWKAKFAASMVPRGMELNENFIAALYQKTREAGFENFLKEVKNDRRIATEELIEFLVKRKESFASKRANLGYERYWHEFVSRLDGIDNAARLWIQKFHGEVAMRVEQSVHSIIEFAVEAHLYNERIPSELYNQPKPVDSIVDDFAVEAQNFANSLLLSAAFSAGALAFVLYDMRQEAKAATNPDDPPITRLGDIWAAIIAGLNILLSFGTMTNASRYKIRNEEARITFFEKKFLGVRKAVFSTMERKTQDTVPEDYNPFLVDLDKKVEMFVYNVGYYDMDEPTEFNEDYGELKANINNPLAIRVFQGKVAGYYIADVYHVNSYLQENLVDIYKVCEDMHTLFTQEINAGEGNEIARHLFNRLTYFSQFLESSLQRGNVYWGFLKHRKIQHWDICICLRYLYSLFCCGCSGGSIPVAPIETETLGILRETRKLSATHDKKVLRREIRDLEYLYWATRESDVASLIFVAAFLVHIVSWFFSIARLIAFLGGPSTVTEYAFWATLASGLSAILAGFHFLRKFFILFGLWCSLCGKSLGAKEVDARRAIGKVRGVTFTQLLLTLLRLVTSIAAAASLAWSVATVGYPDKINEVSDKVGLDDSIPFWIALGAVCAAAGSTIFFFMVEFVVRYSLNPKLGEFVCEAFRGEIENMHEALSIPENDIDSKEVQERETWEYVAREFLHKYRFDTVFAADRFGSVLQYVQGGMESRKDP